MHWARQYFFCLSLLLTGYILGSLQLAAPSSVLAQPKNEELSAGVRDKLREANRSLSEAMQLLKEQKHYVPAIDGINAFATTVGGVDAIADLDSGQGVDPETFAGLYVGRALPEIKERIARDADGRVTYNNKLVRMYNATRLKQLFDGRGEAATATAPATTPKESPAPTKKEADAATEK